jgi:uncharacterized membrane protein YgdD (TMEM256/DUF423 family)
MNYLRISFISMAVAVALGALGAHALKAKLPADSLASWQTAVQYQIVHSLALMIISLAAMKGIINRNAVKIPLALMAIGILFFSGSIYFLSTKTLTQWPLSWLGPVTPLGGVCFIAAWILLVLRAAERTVND